MKKLKILIVEDDFDSAKLLELLLKKYFKELQTIYIKHTIRDAFDCFYEHKPDILFLDVNIGNDLVFTFLEKIATKDVYKICTTSHEKYALKAYEHDVNSYLLKPINTENFISVTEKAINWLSKKPPTNTSDHTTGVNRPFIAIPSIDKVEIIDKKNIVFLEADGKYTIFHLKDNIVKVSTKNMGEYEVLLNKNKFIRIHHKYIINIKEVIKIEKILGYDCLMSNKKLLPVSKRKVNELIRFLNLK